MQKKQITHEVVDNFIIAIKCSSLEDIKRYLAQYDSQIVNRLQSQNRQPSLYFSAILIDHQISYNIMKLLIDHGANAKFKDNFQQTIMFYVCREGKEKCLDLLLQQGLGIDQSDIYGQTPLYYVAKENRLNIIYKLLQKKVDVNHRDKICDQTPLFYAAKQGHLDMCKILIENGANVAHQDTQHKLASHYARRAGKNQVFDYLTSQYQTLKQQKKIFPDVKNQSNQQTKKKKKDSILNSQVPQIKTSYHLYRADNLGNQNQMTQQDFQQFLQSNPELQDMLRNPDNIDLSQIQDIKNQDAWVRFASKTLTICWKAKGGYFFHEPVDPSKYGIDDYFQIIKQPMDFGTIRKKLNYNVYQGVEQFIRDMKLVFENCVKYNGVQNQIARYALQIKNTFEENMKQMGYMN